MAQIIIRVPPPVLKKNKSIWFITFNSNVAARTLQDEEVLIFKRQSHHIFERFDQFIKTVGNAVPDLEPFIDIDPFYEIGTLQHRVHVHFKLEIDHNSKIHVDYPKLREWINTNLRENWHIKGIIIRGASYNLANVMRYLRKDI
jgi:hypothetical protein